MAEEKSADRGGMSGDPGGRPANQGKTAERDGAASDGAKEEQRTARAGDGKSDGKDAEAKSDGDAKPAKPDAKKDKGQSKNGDGDEKRSGESESGDKSDANKPKKKRSRWPLIIFGVLLVVGAIGGFWYWHSTKDLESTDDAYTDGRAATIAPRVSGQVIELHIDDNEFVRQGDLLIRLDPRDYIAARDQSQAQLDNAKAQLAGSRFGEEIAKVTTPARLSSARGQLQQAKAQLIRAQNDARRQHRIDKAATSQQEIDAADAALEDAQGQVATAEAAVKQAEPVEPTIRQTSTGVDQWQAQVNLAAAQLAQAELNLSYTTVVAPQDGWITRRNVEIGNYLQAGQQIASIVAPEVWVTANFKETQLDRMRLGQSVDIAVDAYPDLKLEGHVDSLQQGSGNKFTAFPPENATGNFVKIVQRVPVKIVIDRGLDPALPLPLGLSVTPTVKLK